LAENPGVKTPTAYPAVVEESATRAKIPHSADAPVRLRTKAKAHLRTPAKGFNPKRAVVFDM
jgi:hypothetical protein